MATLREWWKAATKAEQEKLAHECAIAHWSLYTRTAEAGKNYARRVTAELAAGLERASALLHKQNENLPMMKREELCDTCRSCPHALANQKKEERAA